MSPVQNVWRQLVQRRLWPVAILLVAGLAAVPVLLAQDPEPVPAPPAPVAAQSDDELAEQPIVTMASVEQAAKRPRVLGKPKNPFAVKKKPAATAADKPSDTVKTKTDTGKDEPEQDGGSTGGDGGTTTPSTGGGSTPTAPAAPVTPAAPQPKPKTYAPQELTVRWTAGEGQAARRSVKRHEALPSEEEPVLIYLGLLKDGKTAEFLVDHGVVPVGDGECRPSPDECETLRLRAGETQFLDVQDETGSVVGQFQLDLLKIHRPGASSARTSRRTASAARRQLRAALGATSAHLP